MARPKHPNKEIESALQHSEKHGWLVEHSTGNAHCWGQMLCPVNDTNCRNGLFCRKSIWSTPKMPSNHAKEIRRIVDKCLFTRGDE